jgi:outer membrane receptor for monomeric catechols
MIIRLRGNLSARHHIITGVGVGKGSVRSVNQAPLIHTEWWIRRENKGRESCLTILVSSTDVIARYVYYSKAWRHLYKYLTLSRRQMHLLGNGCARGLDVCTLGARTVNHPPLYHGQSAISAICQEKKSRRIHLTSKRLVNNASQKRLWRTYLDLDWEFGGQD